jgi:hypothetical protein
MTFKMLAPIVLTLTGCATMTATTERGEDPAVTKALAGKVAGTPKSCLSLRDATNSASYEGTMLYRASRTLTWRNDMNGCPSLGNDRIPVLRVYSSEVCRGDIVTFADRVTGNTTGACTFGDFVPYRTPADQPR